MIEILRTVIIDNSFIFLQVWSIVHFFVGFALWRFFKLKPFGAVLLIVGFEIIEPFIPGLLPEVAVDTVWDIFLGMMGYFIAKKDWRFK